MTDWDSLEAELDAWRRSGRRATLWWRDDDAAADLPALRRLTAIAREQAVPLSLAAIPAGLEAAAADHISGSGIEVSVMQHGYAHLNHAPATEKKIELGAHRSLADVCAELASGQTHLKSTFGDGFLTVIVPPWNRIAEPVTAALPNLGYRGLSTFGPRPTAEAAPGLTYVNCHLDLMQWKPERRFRGAAELCTALAAQLRARRLGHSDPDEPTGLLSHHLVHDAACWAFLEAMLARLAAHDGARLLSGREVFSVAT